MHLGRSTLSSSYRHDPLAPIELVMVEPCKVRETNWTTRVAAVAVILHLRLSIVSSGRIWVQGFRIQRLSGEVLVFTGLV